MASATLGVLRLKAVGASEVGRGLVLRLCEYSRMRAPIVYVPDPFHFCGYAVPKKK